MRLRVEPLTPVDGRLPEGVLAEVAALYASHASFWRLGGDFPDPDRVTSGQAAAAPGAELADPAAEVLLARAADDRLVALACVPHEHSDPADGHPWIGLLLVDGRMHGRGYGGAVARLAESRLRGPARGGVRLAVLEANDAAPAFWTALGYRTIARRADRQAGRPCRVMHKDLPAAPGAAEDQAPGAGSR
jgi:GNAT superfamily N-acetyltransferase